MSTIIGIAGSLRWSGSQLYVAEAGKVFDAEGNLTDDTIKKLLAGYMAGFAAFINS